MSKKSFNGNKSGFTLVEIMIVVLIIGILLAIAIPNFIKARETSRTKTCLANLSRIDAAKDQFAMDSVPPLEAGDDCVMANIAGVGKYLKTEPKCPSTGGVYIPNTINAPPACNSGIASHVLP